MKYIDSEKLIELIKEWRNKQMGFAWDAVNEVLKIIAPLQQEQPELQGYNKALLEVKSKVDELYEETSIGLCEYDSGLYNGIAETCMKLRGFIKARLDSNEQPEVEFEKELDQWRHKHFKGKRDNDYNGEYLERESQLDLARHFYELARQKYEK